MPNLVPDTQMHTHRSWQRLTRAPRAAAIVVAASIFSNHCAIAAGASQTSEENAVKAAGAKWAQLTATAEHADEIKDREGAEDCYRQALALTGSFAQCDQRKADTLEDLGMIILAQHRYKESLPFLKDCLSERVNCLGPEDTLVAVILQHLGDNYMLLLNNAAGAKCYERALAILTKRFPPGSRMLSLPHEKLAAALERLGKNDAALEHYLEAFHIRAKLIGPDNPALGEDLSRIGALYQHMGKVEEGSRYLQRALAIARSNFGTDSTACIEPLVTVAQTEIDHARFKQAEAPARQAVKIAEQQCGRNSYRTFMAWQTLCFSLDGQGKIAEAEALVNKAMHQAANKDVIQTGFTHCLTRHAEALNHKGDFARAKTYYEKALAATAKTAIPTEHQCFLIGRIGYCNMQLKKVSEGLIAYRKQLDWYRALGHGESKDTALTHGSIGCVLIDKGKYAEAEKEFQTALAILKDHPDVETEFNCTGPYESLLRGQGLNARADVLKAKVAKLKAELLRRRQLAP